MYRLISWRLPQSVVSEEDHKAVLDAKTWARFYKPIEAMTAKTPPPLADLVNRCLAYDAHKRPERMSEVQNALDHMCDDLVKPEDSLEAMEW